MSNKTREEILGEVVSEDAQKMLLADSEITSEHNGISYKMVRSELAHEAMSIYAKQQSIAFAEFITIDHKIAHNSDDNVYYNIYSEEEITTDQLYNLFLQDQNKQP